MPCVKEHYDKAISIHAPHAGRDQVKIIKEIYYHISIHAPHAGRDRNGAKTTLTAVKFQSTRPTRGATAAGYYPPVASRISIHAPHAGRDSKSKQKFRKNHQVFKVHYKKGRAT